MDTTREHARVRQRPQPLCRQSESDRPSSPDQKVLLVGGIPRPVGGVTQHVWRLAAQLGGTRTQVLDLYPGAGKYPLPDVPIRTAPNHSLLRSCWFLRQLWETAAPTIHFHFSTVRRISLLDVVLKTVSRGRRHVLTLHHGELMLGWRELTPRQQRAFVRSLNAFDQIVTLSHQQTEFYESIGRIPSELLLPATSYVPLTDSLLKSLECSRDPLASIPQLGTETRILVASGYPEDIYQHELCLHALDELKSSFPSHLVLCLYGSPRSQSYLKQLLKQCERNDVTVLWDLDFAEFMSILRRASLYLRPTLVDSFGLAVADAINAGVPAVASDVCQRYPGAFLVDAKDPRACVDVCQRVLEGNVDHLDQATDPLPLGCDELYRKRDCEDQTESVEGRTPTLISGQ